MTNTAVITDQDECTEAPETDWAAADRYLDTTVAGMIASGMTRQQAFDLAYPALDAAVADGSYRFATSW